MLFHDPLFASAALVDHLADAARAPARDGRPRVPPAHARPSRRVVRARRPRHPSHLHRSRRTYSVGRLIRPGRIVTASAKAAALGGVGSPPARRPQAGVRWAAGSLPVRSLVTGCAGWPTPGGRPAVSSWSLVTASARWPEVEDGRGGPRRDSRRRAFLPLYAVERQPPRPGARAPLRGEDMRRTRACLARNGSRPTPRTWIPCLRRLSTNDADMDPMPETSVDR
jgi:hypothetical protein